MRCGQQVPRVHTCKKYYSHTPHQILLQGDDSADYSDSDSYNYYYYHDVEQPEMTKRYDIDGYQDITCQAEQDIEVLGWATCH